MHAATVASTAVTTALTDDPHADTGAAYLRAAVWLLATVCGYREAMQRRDYVLAAYWHQARLRAERRERAAWAAFQASRIAIAADDDDGDEELHP